MRNLDHLHIHRLQYAKDGASYKIGALGIIASWGLGWEHVSVSRRDATPSWAEMDHVKRLFWDDEEAAMQLHPPRSQWVNNHPYCLHLWRPIDTDIPLPPSVLVGIKGLRVAP